MPARISFKVTILALFTVLTVALSAIVLGLTYQRGSEAALLGAERLLAEESARIVARTEQLIDPLFSVVNAAVMLPDVEAVAPPRGEHRMAPVMLGVLQRYPQMTAVYLGDGRGNFYRIGSLEAVRSNARAALKAPPEAAFVVQTVTPGARGRLERNRFLDAGRRELTASDKPQATYDPRNRPWYTAARDSSEAVVTDYYPFASVPQIGLTVARRFGDARQTVFGADLTLTSVSRALASARASMADAPSAEIAVFTRDGGLVAHSDNAAYERLLNAAPSPRIPGLSEVGAGVMPLVLRGMRDGEGKSVRVGTADGRQWLAHVSRLPAAFGRDSYVAVAVPIEEVLGPLGRRAMQTLLISLVLVAAFLPLVYLAAGAVSAPLHRLTGEVERLKDLDAAPAPAVRSRVAEIQDLAGALATARSMLGAFAKYVPKNLVRQLIGGGAQPALGGERRPVTVFFSDVRDFTTISEQVAPERLMQFTSEYLEGLVKLILEQRGTVDKFVGDQVVAYWNAPTAEPDHAAHACRAVLACRDWSNAQNERWAREGTPVLYTRFALHLGDAIVGNVGSSDRMDYTVVGATINLGSRIEGLNKVYGTQVLVTRPVADAVRGRFVHRPVDRVLPKGAVHPLEVFELVGAAAAVDAHAVELCEAWTTLYERYAARDFAAAERALWDFIARFGEDRLSALYVERLRRFRDEPPPADWDGVIRYTTK